MIKFAKIPLAFLQDDNPQSYRLPTLSPSKGILKQTEEMVQPNQCEDVVLHKEGFNANDHSRLSPSIPEDPPLRCPVSTPLDGRRPLPQQRRLQFVSVDCTPIQNVPKKIPPDLSNQRMHGKYKCSPNQLRKRNLDYYYVDKQFQNNVEKHTNNSWLKALCAQPVGEIFYKYRKDRPLRRIMDERKLHVLQTPGELAIIQAWENNSNPRKGSCSAVSRQSRRSRNSLSSLRTVSPNLTVTSKGFSRTSDTPRIDSRVDSVPHPPTPGVFEEVSSQSATPTQKIVLNQMDIYSNNYENYNNKMLPEISHKRHLTGPQRRRYFTHPQILNTRRELTMTDSNFELSSSKFSANCTLCVFNEPVLP